MYILKILKNVHLYNLNICKSMNYVEISIDQDY